MRRQASKDERDSSILEKQTYADQKGRMHFKKSNMDSDTKAQKR